MPPPRTARAPAGSVPRAADAGDVVARLNGQEVDRLVYGEQPFAIGVADAHGALAAGCVGIGRRADHDGLGIARNHLVDRDALAEADIPVESDALNGDLRGLAGA
jgi:hypothetical protein